MNGNVESVSTPSVRDELCFVTIIICAGQVCVSRRLTEQDPPFVLLSNLLLSLTADLLRSLARLSYQEAAAGTDDARSSDLLQLPWCLVFRHR